MLERPDLLDCDDRDAGMDLTEHLGLRSRIKPIGEPVRAAG